MKKAILFAVFFLAALGVLNAQWRFMARAEGTMAMAADNIYKEVYGKQLFYPEVKLGLRAVAGLGIWVGYGRSEKSGKTLLLENPTKIKEHIFTAGLGYWGAVGKTLGFIVEIGYGQVRYREIVLDISEKGTASGFLGEAGIRISVGKAFGFTLTGGYRQAKEKLEAETLDLSRFKASAGLDLRL